MPNYLFLITAITFLNLITLGKNILRAQVRLIEKDWVLPTYPAADPEKAPIFFRNEAYQGASRHYYPLAMNDQYTGERVNQVWKTIVLENEYIELAITPEIGGKLYYATDKTNDYHFIYKNNVMKPSNIGMTGAWVSGGIEWCVLHHHRASTFLPIDYTTKENEDGSKTIWIAEYEPRHGMRWTIGVTVFPGKSYFKTEGRIFNASPFSHSFLYWANVAAHANKNYQTIFPPSAQVVTYHSKTDFSKWPLSTEIYRGQDFKSGMDISWWQNVEASASFFVHELKEDFMGGYDHAKNSGTVHIGDHNIVSGAKLWEWGSGPRGQATEARLTENDGPYVELMVGAYSDNQPDYSWIRPYEVKHWEQFWYPVRGIEGFKYANLNGAVNLDEREGNSVFLGYYSTQKVNEAKLILRNKDIIIFEKTIEISPENPFSETIKVDGHFDINDLYTELKNVDTDEVLINYQLVKQEPVKELPEPWKGYKSVEDLNTVEELYLTGKRIEQFYAPRHNKMDWYMAALRLDPNDTRTNTAVGNNYLKNGDYATASDYFARAIERLTKDYTRPSTGEALYLQGLTLRALGRYPEAKDNFYRASWDYAYHSPAYYQLAQLSVMEGDFNKALFQTNESLSTNARNNRAIALKASIQRRMGDFEAASTTLGTISDADPLDFRLRNEFYLIVKEAGDHEKAENAITRLNNEMRDFHENYLELAVGYVNDGLFEEAEGALRRFNGNNPLFDYYLGYVNLKLGHNKLALKYFKSAAGQNVDYIFPHRLETVEVLKTALEYNPGDGKAFYYIGNILYDKQPGYAIENWENAVIHNPGLAIAYRNLGWGYFYHYGELNKAITYYERAIDLNSNEAIYFAELDALYEISNAPIDTRLKLLAGNDKTLRNRDDAFIRLIEVYTLAGLPNKAVELLEGTEFSYREGSSRMRDVRINAYLMLGGKHYDEKEFDSALKHFLEAQIPEEEAGNTRYGNRDIQVSYYIGLAHEALGNRSKAIDFFKMAALQKENGTTDIMSYYQGLSYYKLGDNSKAKKVFESMVNHANKQLHGYRVSEIGVIFGQKEFENIRMSQLYTIKGLGFKGLGKTKKADRDFARAIELSFSNLWAKWHLKIANL